MSVVVTKRGKPVARVTRAAERQRPLMGGMAATAEEVGDIVHFDSSELWEASRMANGYVPAQNGSVPVQDGSAGGSWQ
jgi:antitoxin (DNA-binding transcriptional repressor) of toxin-antitoxin stability system